MPLWRSRRALRRRIGAVSTRLEPSAGELLGRGSTEAALARLERAADAAALERSDAIAAAERFSESMQLLGLGIVVADENAEIVFRNERSAELLSSRHAEALARDSIASMLAAAVDGEPSTNTLDVFGPP